MYPRETRVLLRHYLEQGVGKSELARRFGVSRRTIYHWIEMGQLDRDLIFFACTRAAIPSSCQGPQKPQASARKLRFVVGDYSVCLHQIPVSARQAHKLRRFLRTHGRRAEPPFCAEQVLTLVTEHKMSATADNS